MADDAAAPDGELSEASEKSAEETSTAAEPESAAEVESSGGVEADDTRGAAESDPAEPDPDPDSDSESADEKPAKAPMSHVRLATIIGVVVVVALAGLSGWLGYRAYQSYQAQQKRELYLQVGRQGALNLTTISAPTADADVQRILDSATGTFYDDFQRRSQPFVEVVKQAQSKSVGTISEAGLESETDDGARVLVAVNVKTSNAGAPEQPPRAWRMRLTVQQVGDEAKVSNVEFVP